MPSIVLLGPQRPLPNTEVALTALGVEGPVAAVTAGWSHPEDEADELAAVTQLPTVDLEIYQRLEQSFEADPELFDAHRQRQDKLKELQRLYRIRLTCAINAASQLQKIQTNSELVESQRQAAIDQIRTIDSQHIVEIQRIHSEFEERWMPSQRLIIAQHRQELKHMLTRFDTVIIAGGHVGVLLSRSRLLGLGELLSQHHIIAWSAGAMVLTDRVVVFHDFAPQGRREPEIFDVGLGLQKNLVVLPHAKRRLDLEDQQYLGIIAQRFAPDQCVTMDNASLLYWQNSVKKANLIDAHTVSAIRDDGQLVAVNVNNPQTSIPV